MKRNITATATGDGNYAVSVDGRIWCYAIREPRGMHGASYKLRYHQGSGELFEDICEPAKRGSPVVVWSDKHWLSSQGMYGRPDMAKRQAIHEGTYKYIQQRLAETVERLVRKKLIISPDERAQQAEARAELSRKRREEFEAASRKRLDDKAKEVVRKFSTGETVVYSDDQKRLRLLIVEAMEWARSNT